MLAKRWSLLRSEFAAMSAAFRGTRQGLREFSSGRFFKHNPFDTKNAYCRKPLFPICSVNLRLPGMSGYQPRLRGRGRRRREGRDGRHFRNPDPFWRKGTQSLAHRLPRWKGAIRSWRRRRYDWVNLLKLRRWIEAGRLDARFIITQKHMNDSKLTRVRHGVKLYNMEELPFPYKVHVDVFDADQSSIEAIRRVGGSVAVVHRTPAELRAHIHPQRFALLPAATPPTPDAVAKLERLRFRGCLVQYLKPDWLAREEGGQLGREAVADAERRAAGAAETAAGGAAAGGGRRSAAGGGGRRSTARPPPSAFRDDRPVVDAHAAAVAVLERRRGRRTLLAHRRGRGGGGTGGGGAEGAPAAPASGEKSARPARAAVS